MARIRITLVHSAIGHESDQKRTVRALGLHRLHETVEHEDNRSIRGMIHKIEHLVKVEQVEGA